MYNIPFDTTQPVILQMNDSLEAFVMEKLTKMPANEEVAQNKSVKKAKLSLKVETKVLNGHESPSNHPPNIPISHPKSTSIPLSNLATRPTSHSQQHALPPNNMGSTNVVELKGKKDLKRKTDSPVPQLEVKSQRNIKKVKYNEVDDEVLVQQPMQKTIEPTISTLTPLSHCNKILLDMLKPPANVCFSLVRLFKFIFYLNYLKFHLLFLLK